MRRAECCDEVRIAVGALCVRSHEPGVIAPDLGAGALRVIEELEIVNRHDTRRPSGGNQQRVCRVDDVERPANEPLDRRHTGPVPPPVQDPHGHPPIVHRDARRVGRELRMRPVLP